MKEKLLLEGGGDANVSNKLLIIIDLSSFKEL